MPDRDALLAALRTRLSAADRVRPPGRKAPLATGVPAIDAVLTGGGLARAGLHEVLGDETDAARFGFIAAVLGRLPAADGRVLWCRARRASGTGVPYGPGLAPFGLDPGRLIVIESRRPAETLALMEEGLRARRLAAVVGDGVEPSLTESRRLQLAAETGDTLALLLLAHHARSPPSVALTRWRVAAAPGEPDAGGVGRPRWSVALLRCRGGGIGSWIVEWDDEALSVDLVSPLADRPLAAAGAPGR